MLNKIKLLASLLIIACLFLPLSTCTSKPHAQAVDQTEKVFERYAVIVDDVDSKQKTSIIQRYGAALLFCLPFIFALAAVFRAVDNMFYTLVEVVAGLAALFVVAVHGFTGELALGGYIALTGGLTYTLLAIMLFFRALISRFRKPL